MEPLTTALQLLRRIVELENAMRLPGGIRVTEERELFAIRERLKDFPAAVRAIAELTGARRQSLDQICVEDVERWDARG